VASAACSEPLSGDVEFGVDSERKNELGVGVAEVEVHDDRQVGCAELVGDNCEHALLKLDRISLV
jgi:hypothetical protein